MQGMDNKHDGHVWCKVNTTNIKNNFNLTFQSARCLGHLQCQNDGYDFFLINGCRNKIAWNGHNVHDLKGYFFALDPPFCKIYNSGLLCVNLCVARMYYVMHKQKNLIRTMIHLDTHDHPMVESHFKEVFKQVKSLVKDKVSCTPWATTSTIVLVANKTFLSKPLLNEDGKRLVEIVNEDQLLWTCQLS